MVARNGSGKSSVLAAIAGGRVPGVPSNLRVVYVGQGGVDLDTSSPSASSSAATQTPLDVVVASDKLRTQLLADQRMLGAATGQSAGPLAAVRAARQLRLRDLRRDLQISEQVATFRSGARGFKARKELRVMEGAVDEAAARAAQPDDEIDAEAIASDTAAAIERLADVEARLSSAESETAEVRATKILLGLGFKKDMLAAPHANLSGGWVTRCGIAAGLFQTSDVLLLDEPTNYLDLPAIIWLKDYINRQTDKTVVVVTHDRAFGDGVASTLLLLRDSAFTVFHGTLSSYIRETRKQARHFTRMKEAQDRAETHLKAQIAHNVQSARKSGDDKKLKQAASRKKKLDERMGLEVGLKGGRFKLNRDLGGYHLKARADITIPTFEPAVRFALPEPPDLKVTGNLVTCEGAAFHYPGAKRYTLHNVNLSIGPHDRIGLLGFNGAGKSTLVKLLLGPELDPSDGLAPNSGTVSRHPRMRAGVFAQSAVDSLHARGAADPSLTALGAVRAAAPSLSEAHARAVLSGLGLAGRTASDVPVAMLSGGQRVRAALGLVLAHPPHLLVLDEVTCHLDADSVTALAVAVAVYKGAVVVVSHDRFFVRAVVEGNADAGGRDAGGGGDATGDGELEESEEESEGSDEGEGRVPGRVYLVEAGKVRLLEGGVGEYEDACERRVRGLRS